MTEKPIAIARLLPIVGWLPNYERAWLRSDLIAGLTVVALLIPEGMAYAQIAGVPPQAAFYAAPIGLLLFAVLGSSRQLVVAVSAAIATMSFATVSQIAEPNTTDFIVLTAALAVLSGVIGVLAGILRLGRVAAVLLRIGDGRFHLRSRPGHRGETSAQAPGDRGVERQLLGTLLARGAPSARHSRSDAHGRARMSRAAVRSRAFLRSTAGRARRTRGGHRCLRRVRAGCPRRGGRR